MANTLNNEIALLDTMRETILQARKKIAKSRRIKLARKKQVANLKTRIRRELDSTPMQTIISNGLFIDYDPNYKRAKFKKYFPDEINEPFNINYTKPDKLIMSQYADQDAKVIYLNEHVATLEYTKYIVEDIDDGPTIKDGEFGDENWGNSYRIPDADSGVNFIEVDWYGRVFEGNQAMTPYIYYGRFHDIIERRELERIHKDDIARYGSRVSNATLFHGLGERGQVLWIDRLAALPPVAYLSPDAFPTTHHPLKFFAGVKTRIFSSTRVFAARAEMVSTHWNRVIKQEGINSVYRYTGHPFGYAYRHELIGEGQKKRYMEYTPIGNVKIFNRDFDSGKIKLMFNGPMKAPTN